MCREILESARSKTGNQIEQMDLPLPPSFRSLFRDIVLFLLSISLVARDSKNYAVGAEKCCYAVEIELSECETALQRAAREHTAHLDDEYMHESIKTADTLLGLLLQNAYSLSCSDKGTADSKAFATTPHCDLEQIYWRWTSVCVSIQQFAREPSLIRLPARTSSP